MIRRRRARQVPPDAGVVEFTGLLPLILVTVLIVWEGFLLGMSATYAGHAANEGARVAAVGGGYDEVERAAVKRIYGAWADEENIEVVYPGGERCSPVPLHKDCGYVRVSIKTPLLIPGVVLPTRVSARAKVVYEGVR
ncbi:TadE/TadG family type IV pilus assembly protein [Actinomadura sp. 9N407]|uniref:TadE/TadG family type IV pilus assembly protein n=1 Tax=Actinomadura sp. 9N407 TaxID=3375154 RepID=UPI0037B7F5A6